MSEEYKDIPDPFRKWVMIILGGIVVVCLIALVVIFAARKQLATLLLRSIASETPTSTTTSQETPTFTLFPSETDTLQPITAETSLATPNRTPAMDIMAQISGPPLLDDKFADNNNNWMGFGQNAEFLIQENTLQMRSTSADLPAVLYCSGQRGIYENNFYYQVELVEDRASSFGIGIVFGLNVADSSLFNFAIKPSSNAFTLTRLNNGVWENLIDWTPSQYILPFPQHNVLGASVQDGTIQLYVNGTRIGNYSQKDLSGAGRIGMFTERDGVRLLAHQAMAYQLIPFGGTTSAPITTAMSTVAPPTLLVKYTYTPTAEGSCPPTVPSGSWVLLITKNSKGRETIRINGVENKVDLGVNAFYLLLNTDYVVHIGGKSYEFHVKTCKIVNLKMK